MAGISAADAPNLVNIAISRWPGIGPSRASVVVTSLSVMCVSPFERGAA